MFALYLVILLAWAPNADVGPSPAAVASPPSPAARAPISSPSPQGALSPDAPTAAPTDAVIVNSGSTNEYGYRIVVHPDATADVTIGPATNRATVPKADAQALFAELASVPPFGALEPNACMKSTSFGYRQTIAYGGRISPDLTCVAKNTAGDALNGAVAAIVADVGIPTVRPRHARRYPT